VCHDPPSFADGRVYSDKAFSDRQVGVVKPEEEPSLRSSSIRGYRVLGPKAKLVKHKFYQIPKISLVHRDIYREVLITRKMDTNLVLGMCELSLQLQH